MTRKLTIVTLMILTLAIGATADEDAAEAPRGKPALLSHDADLTRAVEEITGAVRPENPAYMILNAPN